MIARRFPVRTVVIVEDEKLVMLGIVSLFENSSRYRVAGSFSDPEIALREIQKNMPDIVITDIKMPHMDGLELIRRIKACGNDCKIIVLSCYDDFSIVNQAFKLGIVDYLLKHELDECNLFNVLDSIEFSTSSPSESEQDVSTANRIFSGTANTKEFIECLARIKTQNPPAKSILLSLLVCKKMHTETLHPIPVGIDILWSVNFVQNLLDTYHVGEAFYHGHDSIVIVLEGDNRFEQSRKDFFQDLLKQVGNYINNPVVILRGQPSSLAMLNTQWEDLLSSRGCVFYATTNRIIQIGTERTIMHRDTPPLPDPIALLHPDQRMEWKRSMERFFSSVKELKLEPSVLCMDLIVYWHQIDQLVQSLMDIPLSNRLDGTNIYDDIKEFDDFNSLWIWYMTTIENGMDVIGELHGHRRNVMKIKLFLLQNYKNRISLSMLSEHFHLSGNYLCGLFKKETGIGYVEYLNTIRINQAKKLLLETDDTVENICLQVGFSNSSHFSRIFKRTTGQTVTEFRDPYSENQKKNQET